MPFDKDEDGNHKSSALLNIFDLYIVSNVMLYQYWQKKFQEKLLLNKKSIYYTNLHKKGKKVTSKLCTFKARYSSTFIGQNLKQTLNFVFI